ncbi:MAG: SGNH/GDSL hydrolase family protein [Myxococcota bacterium]
MARYGWLVLLGAASALTTAALGARAVRAEGEAPPESPEPLLAEGPIRAAVRAGASAGREAPSLDSFLSPLTPEVVAHLREVAARVPNRRDDVFAKLGDSATVNRGFLRCFARADEVALHDHADLAETIAFFRDGNAGGRDPYRRDSMAAKVGWSAHNVLKGHPSPLLREVRAISPRFAVVMFGTNDIEMKRPQVFADRMRAIVDALTARGVIPILSSVTPRNSDADADRLVPTYGRIVEAIARARQVPFIDLHAALAALPDRGLMSDGVHPSTYIEGNSLRGCDFGPEGLRFGQNVRNLLTMRMLHRLRRAVVEGEPAPDPSVPPPAGAGTASDPVRVERLPFAVMDTTAGADASIGRYDCDASKDESGPERVYRLRVGEPMRLRVQVLHRHADVDVHLLGARAVGAQCEARADSELVVDVPAGIHHVAVDTFVPEGGEAAPGEYVLLLEPAPDAEPAAD